jgi:hypothetical protein
MNHEVSEELTNIFAKLNKAITFQEGIQDLISFRNQRFDEWKSSLSGVTKEEYHLQPYINHQGYEKKNIAYSLYHVFRIEDIVCNTLIQNQMEVFFDGYKEKMLSPIITTGNELVKEEIARFTEQLNLDMLWEYGEKVKDTTNEYLQSLDKLSAKRKITQQDKARVIELGVVSSNPLANWLVDYWGSKNIDGLLRMPFSRHWLMHEEASFRIKDKVIERRKK